MHLPCLFPLRCAELFVAVAAVSVAELFAAVAAGDTVAVLLFGPLFRRAAVAVPELFAAVAAGDTVVVLLQSPLCNTSAASIRRKVYASGRAPRAPTAHRRRQVGMAAKRAGAARRWKNKTKCTASSCP